MDREPEGRAFDDVMILSDVVVREADPAKRLGVDGVLATTNLGGKSAAVGVEPTTSPAKAARRPVGGHHARMATRERPLVNGRGGPQLLVRTRLQSAHHHLDGFMSHSPASQERGAFSLAGAGPADRRRRARPWPQGLVWVTRLRLARA
jgi:hypothetical protein